MTEGGGKPVFLCNGRGALTLRLPSDASPTMIRKPSMPLLDDPDAAVRAALDHPIGTDKK